MRILAACGELPWPTDTGHKLVSINDLRYLSEVFDVEAINLVPTSIPKEKVQKALTVLHEQLPAVRFHEPIRHDISGKHNKLEKGVQLLRSFVGGIPYLVSKYRNQEYANKVRTLIRQDGYAALMIESTPLSFLIHDVPEISNTRIPVIFRAHDILSETIAKYGSGSFASIEAWLAKIEARRTKRFEEMVWNASRVIAPVTKRLTVLISERIGQSDNRFIMYLPVPINLARTIDTVVDKGSGLVLYVGTIHYPPNLQGLRWFLDMVWPRIVEMHPNASFRIIGKGGHLLGTHDSSVEILDYVPDLQEHYAEADVLVVPLFSGSGIRLKILDSFSNGIPVVSTTEGYLGLDVTPGVQLLVADDHITFARAVVDVIESAELRNRLRTMSAQFLVRNHSADDAQSAFKRLQDYIKACLHV